MGIRKTFNSFSFCKSHWIIFDLEKLKKPLKTVKRENSYREYHSKLSDLLRNDSLLNKHPASWQ